MRPPMIWSRRGGGWSLNWEFLASSGCVNDVVLEKDSDGDVDAWKYACFG